MPISKNQKKDILSLILNEGKSQKSIVFLTTKGAEKPLDSFSDVKFRKQARSSGVIVKVVKNTLINLAFPELPSLQGQTYVAFAQNASESDEVTVPKNIVNLSSEDFKDQFKVLGSIVAGSFLNDKDTLILSKTPSKSDSMAMVAGAVNSVISQIPRLVSEVSAQLARATNEVKQQKA